VYASPSELDSLPAVVGPASSSQQILCKAIPGLYQFDRTFMPNLYSDFDSTLSSTKFLLRFFRALQILGSEVGDDQARFAMKNLNDANLQVGFYTHILIAFPFILRTNLKFKVTSNTDPGEHLTSIFD
jgi:sacsin